MECRGVLSHETNPSGTMGTVLRGLLPGNSFVHTRFFSYKKVSTRLINKNFLKKSAILLMKLSYDFLKYNFHKKVIIFNIYDTFLIHAFQKLFIF